MILAADLNAQKARVLLMLAVMRATDPAEVRTIFASYTLGEQ
jgi:L-asparaginase/Glu-tRNA(Gln) amidotransferase subunit D